MAPPVRVHVPVQTFVPHLRGVGEQVGVGVDGRRVGVVGTQSRVLLMFASKKGLITIRTVHKNRKIAATSLI